MTAAYRTFALAAAAMTALAAVPAAAMPVSVPSAQAAIVKVAGWATRAEGRSHTYPDTYGYAYGYGYGDGRGGYGAWGDGGYAVPYGAYGRAVLPAYGYGEDVYGY